MGWVGCWFSPLLREVFLRLLRFSPLLKNQHFQIPIRSGTHGHVSTSSYELLSDPWVNKLQFTIFFTKMYAPATSRNPLQSCLVFHLILDLLQKTSFWANFNSSYDIILRYLVKNSIQRNINWRGEKRVGAGWGKLVSFTKITKEMNQ